MGFLQLPCGIHQETGAAQLGGHIRKLKRNALLGSDGLPELDALFGIIQSLLKRALGNPQRLCGNADAPAVKGSHGNLEAFPFLAQKVLFWHLYIIENQFSRGRGTDAHLVIMVAKLKSLPALLYDKSGNPAGADIRGGYCKYNVGICLGRIGDENLAAV